MGAVPDGVLRAGLSAFEHALPRFLPVQLTRERLLVVKAGFVLASVLASAAVLHFRGTPDALLATDSFVGATFSVVFWALPAFALYLLIPWSMTAIVIEGLLILALLVTTWWSSATDTHSTASLGPGFAGWLFAPAIIVLGVIVTAVARRLAKGRGRDAR